MGRRSSPARAPSGAAALRCALAAGLALLRGADARDLRGAAVGRRATSEDDWIANFVTGQVESSSSNSGTPTSSSTVVKGEIDVTGVFSASQASSLTGHLVNLVMDLSGLPGVSWESSEGANRVDYTFLLLPDDASQAASLVSKFYLEWTQGVLKNDLSSRVSADSGLGGVTLNLVQLAAVSSVIGQQAITPPPTTATVVTSTSTFHTTTTSQATSTASTTTAITSSLTSMSESSTTAHTTTETQATSTGTLTSETESSVSTTALANIFTSSTTTTSAPAVIYATSTTTAGVLAAAADSDDGVGPLVFVLCGAGMALLCLGCCAAVFVYCMSLSAEQMEAHFDRSRSLVVFKKPLQRFHSKFSAGSLDGSPKSRGSDQSKNTFFCGERDTVLNQFAQADWAKEEAVEAQPRVGSKPRVSPRASLEHTATTVGPRIPGGATSPRPGPPQESPRVSATVPGSVSET
ncbi:unnamed protein product [Prorocentrum cordatum]|uniref:Uncharacterized protein n=1 Tax=Prorocentrum cordatum TaxID=2364126 RepID=A0ABN9T3P0_9DINO|nr:unnamed protein product [Polarella glacialis]